MGSQRGLRIDPATVRTTRAYLEVQMCRTAGRIARVADMADQFAGLHRPRAADIVAQVRVVIRVADALDVRGLAAERITLEEHRPIRDRDEGGASGGEHVVALVRAAATSRRTVCVRE